MRFEYIKDIDLHVVRAFKSPRMPALRIFFRVEAARGVLLQCEAADGALPDRRLAYSLALFPGLKDAVGNSHDADHPFTLTQPG